MSTTPDTRPRRPERLELGLQIGGAASGSRGSWDDTVTLVREAERIGYTHCWGAEAWGQDSITPLAYLSALAPNMRFGTAVTQVTARAPSMTAMTAMTLAAITGDRFVLGLGVSGPQVVEGFHSTRYEKPVRRLRELVSILRLAFAGDKLEFAGEQYQLPLPGGPGKALRLALPANPNIPIFLAALGPLGLQLTGEVADGWLGGSFVPERCEDVYVHLAAGAAKANRTLDDLQLHSGVPCEIGTDVEDIISRYQQRLAFTLGAMGSSTQNFYNQAYQRMGFADECIRVQQLWLDGHRTAAAAAVPIELVQATFAVGDADLVRERFNAHLDAGISHLRLTLDQERSLEERIETLGVAYDLAGQLDNRQDIVH